MPETADTIESIIQGCPEEEDHPFVMVPTTIARSADMSFDCIGLLTYLLSHAPIWRISIPYIIQTKKISKNKIYPLLKEAMHHGYLKCETYLKNGLKRYVYTVSRSPKFKKCLPCPQNQDTENEDRILDQVSNDTKEQQHPLTPSKKGNADVSSVEDKLKNSTLTDVQKEEALKFYANHKQEAHGPKIRNPAGWIIYQITSGAYKDYASRSDLAKKRYEWTLTHEWDANAGSLRAGKEGAELISGSTSKIIKYGENDPFWQELGLV